ncbi:hypothetical protein [Prosthecobacter sp.]|uniref:hypothetical protein n=1 Tax=Prosthecobacter sp. TaxID=1965333 RepID=UPI003784EC82
MPSRALLLLLALLWALQAHAATGLRTRTFRIPPDFIACDLPPVPDLPDKTADPFAAPLPAPAPPPEAPVPKPRTPRQILEAAGITFPEGASASFNPFLSLLTVTNTEPNLDLVSLYVDSLHHLAPVNIAYTLTVIEGPGELIREAAAQASLSPDTAPALTTLLGHAEKPASAVRVIADAFLETKSGSRATFDAVREYNQTTALTLDTQSRASIVQDIKPLGLHWEIEPFLSSDATSIETTLGLTLSAAPPVERQISVDDPITGHTAEFPATDIPGAHIVTSLSIPAGGTRLIGITKPLVTPKEENADVLCAAFLTATLRRVEALPMPQPKAAAPPAVPEGMIFAAMNAPDGIFAQALQRPRPLTLQEWLTRAGVTFPTGSVIEHRAGVLRCVNTADNIALIAALVEREFAITPKTVALTFHTLEVPAPLLRDLARRTLASSSDDSAIFAAAEAAVARGEASFISSSFVEAKSGTQATHHAVREHHYLGSFSTDDAGRPNTAFETRKVGDILEVEPTIGADNSTVYLTLTHELHPTPAVLRRGHFRDPASQQPFDIPLTDFNVHKTLTSFTLAKGSTKLLALHPPAGRPGTGVLCATFVKCDVVSHFPKSPSVTAEPSPPKPAADPKAIQTRSFRVAPDFLSTGQDSASTDKDKDKDKSTQRKTARMILEEAGIPFPEGTFASLNTAMSLLVVRNTNENLDLIETYNVGGHRRPATIAFTTHILQGPAPLLRRLTAQAASKSDHRAELDELLAAVKKGTVHHLNTAHLEAKSGATATATQAREHTALSSVSITPKGQPLFKQTTRNVGLIITLEPTLGADRSTIEVNISPEFHTAPPLEHREHLIDTQGRRLEFPLTDYFTSQLTTGITIIDGTARLLSLYKPTGTPEFEKQDILQVIFITCDLLPATK